MSKSEDEINSLLASKGIYKGGHQEAEDDGAEAVENKEEPNQHDGNEL